jgi:peptide/nickel transport system ATP-binding protein
VTPAPLLDVAGLGLEFRTRTGVVKALEDVSFSVARGEIVGVVGESGSGKSVTAFAIMGLLDETARITSGAVSLSGVDLLADGRRALRDLRGREMSMIFQSPRTALNPIRKVGRQIEDVLVRHGPTPRAEARARAVEALRRVRIPDPERRYDAYPFELSGGMCQRVMIAMALACGPMLLIADEPTTGLDVTTQAVVMDLIAEIVAETRMGAVLITHDLALAGEYCDRIVVMHAGHVVERGPAEAILTRPAHSYTRQLVAATPAAAGSIADLAAIPGGLPDLRRADLPFCRFEARCALRERICGASPTPVEIVGDRHDVRCWRPA